MTLEKIRQRIDSLASHFTFEYKGFSCGVDPISRTHFDVWCGDSFIALHSVDDVINTPLFIGKPLKDIVQDIKVIDI